MFSIWIWCFCVEILSLIPMANKRASPKEFNINVLRKVKPNINHGDGTNDEVDEDELEKELKKEKKRKYKHVSRT